MGSTDSERAFCSILEALKVAFSDKPDALEIAQLVSRKAEDIRQFGSFNFLLSNGSFLIAHCSTDLHYLIRQHPFAEAQLKDCDMTVDFQEVTRPTDRVAVIATQPLTVDEQWTQIASGQFLVFKEGRIVE